MESFDCICGEHFGSMEELREHWKTDNSQTTGRPHYRLVTGSSSSEEWTQADFAKMLPPRGRTAMRDDRPRRKWHVTRAIEEALRDAEPAAEWLRKHPPGARLPDNLEPGHDEPEEYVPESKGVDE